MTNEDRQTVIDALEAAIEALDDLPTWGNAGYQARIARDALAIMRREREPVAWMAPGGICVSQGVFINELTDEDRAVFATPLYKD